MTTLVLPDFITSQLRRALQEPLETGAVMLARPVITPRGALRLLAVQWHPVPEAAYRCRTDRQLQINSEGFVPPLRHAEEAQAVPIWFHTHPGEGASPLSSRQDGVVDYALAPLFRLRAGSPYYGQLIASPAGAGWRFSGHLEGDGGRRVIERLWAAGERFSLTHRVDTFRPEPEVMFDRHVRAFGGQVQQVLSDLTVAIVGCGGTGSAVAEQLVRLGVRQLILVDPDVLSDSNLTRLYGSGVADVGRHKVAVIADHLRRISPAVRLTLIEDRVTAEPTARALMDADMVFGCTDDNAGRLVLSRFSAYFLTPLIDCGVIFTSTTDGTLDGIFGRVTTVTPGAACLVCRGRIDLARAQAEMLPPQERVVRQAEGYAPALPGVEPAVVTFTSAVAAQAVAELLERLTAYGPTPVPNEVLLRFHDREISTNRAAPRARHYCHPEAGKLGLGLTDSYLEQVWPG